VVSSGVFSFVVDVLVRARAPLLALLLLLLKSLFFFRVFLLKIGQKKVTHSPRFACHRAPVHPRDGVAFVRHRTLGVFFVVDVVWILAARGGRWKDIDFART